MVKIDKPLGWVQVAGTKILDINEDDTGVHTCGISTSVPSNCIAVLLVCKRASGTGHVIIYPDSGTQNCHLCHDNIAQPNLVSIANQELKYSQTVADDDFNLYLFGYIVEGEVKK